MFLTENQAVVLYAVDVHSGGEDPPVVMASNVELYEWYDVCPRLSEFLHEMLYIEGAYGGVLKATGSAVVPRTFRKVLERHLEYVGEVNKMLVYGRAGGAACFVKWDDGWRVFAGATSRAHLVRLEKDLGIELAA